MPIQQPIVHLTQIKAVEVVTMEANRQLIRNMFKRDFVDIFTMKTKNIRISFPLAFFVVLIFNKADNGCE